MIKLKRKIGDVFFISFFIGILSLLLFIIVGNVGYIFISLKTGLLPRPTPYIYNGEFDYLYSEQLFDVNSNQRNNNKLADFFNLISLKKKAIESYCTDNAPFRMIGVQAKKKLDKIVGFDFVCSQGLVDKSSATTLVIPFEEEWLGWCMQEGENNINTNSVIKFANLMKEEGRNFFVFENPEKFSSFYGFNNISEENRISVNKKLNENGIDVFDIDEYMKVNSIDYKSIFFKTDHHWKTSSGLWGNKLLCNYLNEKFNYDIDTKIFDIENYYVEILENHFLGSLGCTATEVYIQKEDFEIITPKYETDITVFNSAYAETRSGTIADTLYKEEALEEKNDYKRDDYGYYGYGDTPLIISHNNKLHDGSSLLIIKMSFADVQIPTLTQAVENFYAIDLRHFTGSLISFIHKHNPKTVVLAYPTRAFIVKPVQGNEKKYPFNFN